LLIAKRLAGRFQNGHARLFRVTGPPSMLPGLTQDSVQTVVHQETMSRPPDET